MEDSSFCTKCGEKLDEENKFCPKCGSQADPNENVKEIIQYRKDGEGLDIPAKNSGKKCFVCNKGFGMFADKYNVKEYAKERIPIPEGMNSFDKVCNDCFKTAREKASNEQKRINDEIRARVPEYKTRWDKHGVIQYKDDYVAILHRFWGQQVEFIIAYSDLTKEGYRLMAQDEGKTASGGGTISGGVNSYYYFQKPEYVR